MYTACTVRQRRMTRWRAPFMFPSDSFRPCGHIFWSKWHYTYVAAPIGRVVFILKNFFLPRFTFSSDLFWSRTQNDIGEDGWAYALQPIWYDKPCGSFLTVPSIFYFRCSIALGFQFKFLSPCLWRCAGISVMIRQEETILKDCADGRVLGTTTCMLFSTHWCRARA